MEETHFNQSRFSRIETLWSVVRNAHDQDPSVCASAQEKLLEIYGSAVQRYLLTAIKEESVARDLYQEFALKLVRGDFRHSAPENGHFRFFVKTVVRNMIRSHFRKLSRQKNSAVPVDELCDSADVVNVSSDQEDLAFQRHELEV